RRRGSHRGIRGQPTHSRGVSRAHRNARTPKERPNVPELDLEEMERRLMQERRQTLESIRQAESEEAEGQGQSGGALARVPSHLADAASDTQEEEKDLANITRASEQLTRIDEALRRLRDDPESY